MDYFTFKPSGSGTIWVTIAKINWHWQGSAYKDANGVFQSGTDPSSGFSANPQGSASTELPRWSNDIGHVTTTHELHGDSIMTTRIIVFTSLTLALSPLLSTAAVAQSAQPAVQDGLSRGGTTEQMGPRVDGYRLGIQIGKNLFLSTDPISVTVLLKNTGADTLPLVVANPAAFFSFTVVRQDGQAVPLTLWGKSVTRTSQYTRRPFMDSLAPGQSLSITYQLSRMYDMTVPGVYQVTASTTLTGRRPASNSVTLTSNTAVLNMGGDDIDSVFGTPTVGPPIAGKTNPFVAPTVDIKGSKTVKRTRPRKPPATSSEGAG